MVRRAGVVLLLGLMMSALAACADAESAVPARSVPIEVIEFAIHPSTSSAQVGERLTFVVTNKGVLDHDLTIVGPDGKELADVLVKHGRTASLDFRPSAPGRLQLICTINGHQKAGMAADLVVNP
jgi:uncharacterized cupredoxin-like copper-binding protein